MKILISTFLLFAFISPGGWTTDLGKAQKDAAQTNKLILLNFSGSDWCVPCIKTKKEIFDSEEFMKYASENLALVNADFPRQKKNLQGAALVKSNEALAEKYNPNGEFPLTILMDATGKILKEWEGFPGVTPAQFVEQLKNVSSASK